MTDRLEGPVAIAKGATTETLVYDKDGKFVRKMAQTAGATENKAVSPAPKPTKTPKK
jgi:hypothetical protein